MGSLDVAEPRAVLVGLVVLAAMHGEAAALDCLGLVGPAKCTPNLAANLVEGVVSEALHVEAVEDHLDVWSVLSDRGLVAGGHVDGDGTLVKNKYHNGHPDLVPAGHYDGDSILHGTEGIEVKASRYPKGWQGHNPEDTWLMVFVFSSNTLNKGEAPVPFRFEKVVGAQLLKSDWKFAGRSATSRRTITATVTAEGCAKMESNWIYRLDE